MGTTARRAATNKPSNQNDSSNQYMPILCVLVLHDRRRYDRRSIRCRQWGRAGLGTSCNFHQCRLVRHHRNARWSFVKPSKHFARTNPNPLHLIVKSCIQSHTFKVVNSLVSQPPRLSPLAVHSTIFEWKRVWLPACGKIPNNWFSKVITWSKVSKPFCYRC